MITQKCKQCQKDLPKTTEYFSKYSSINNTIEPGLNYHSICKQCEYEKIRNDNWKDGLLKCHICGKYFPEETFHKIGKKTKKYSYRNNRDSRCPKCKLEQIKSNRNKYSGEEKLNAILLSRFHGAQDRALKNNIPFDITLNDIRLIWEQQKGLCAISKLPMTFDLYQGRTFTNVSIDQINPHLGYTKENIQLVCMAVNQMKSDMSLEELYMFCEAIIKNKK